MHDQSVRQKLDQIVDESRVTHRDLWPTIQAKVVSVRRDRRFQKQAGGLFMTIFFRRTMVLRTLSVILGLVLLLTVLGVPSVRANVESFLEQSFGIVLVPAARPMVSSGTAPQPLPSAQDPNTLISLEEAQQQVPFAIPQPGWLPTGLTLQGARVGHGPAGGQTMEEVLANAPVQVSLIYRPDATSTQGIFVQITQGRFEGGYTFSKEHAQMVQVHDHAATYIKGSWNDKGQWQEDADYSTLSWEQDGFTYVLRSSQLGISLEDMTRIATSFR